MDFFKSLNEIRKNRHQFGVWEKEQKDKQAQRDALNNSREYSPEEIEKARALGENIINAIDVMDNHSESVAENVETATAPIVGLSPYLGGGAALVASTKYLISPAYAKMRAERREILDSDAAKKLAEEINTHYEKANNVLLTNFETHSLLDEWRTDKIDNITLKNKVKDFQKDYAKKIAKYNKKINLGIWGTVGAAIVSFIAANIYTTSLQVESSKIARYQARKFLEDPKAFVNYTPEQIAQAKAEIEANPELIKAKKKEKGNLNQGFFKSIKGLFRDRAEYKYAKMLDTDDSKMVQRDLTAEELKQAERDKEVIQRSVKIINNQAEKYSENMEVAAGVIIGGTPVLGAISGGLVKFVLEKTGLLDKYVDGQIAKTGDAKVKALYEDYKTLALKKNKNVKDKIEQKFKFAEFISEFHNATENSKDEIKKVSLTTKWKNGFTTAMVNRTSRGWVMAGIGAAISAMGGLYIGLKLQKSAARAGRYNAKRELEEDPKNFIGYTQEDYKEVENIKSTSKDKSKVKEVLMFIPNVLKQYYAYDNYRKHGFVEEQLLNEQLRKQDVTEEQLKEAKNLQRKIFNTFEKVDDNSQVYSESMEAAIEIAQPFVMYGGFIAALTPIAYYINLVSKGKKSPAEAIKMITKFLDKGSGIMKTGIFKKYLKSIEKNMPNAVQQNIVSSRPLASILAGVNIADDTVISILQKATKNIKNSVKDYNKLDDEVIYKNIYNIKDLLNKSGEKFDADAKAFMNKVLDNFTFSTKQEQHDILNIILNPETIKDMPEENYKNAIGRIKYMIKNSCSKENWNSLEKAIQELDASTRGDNAPIRAFDDIFNDFASKENATKLSEVFENLKLNNIEEYLPETARNLKFKDITKKFIEEYAGNPKESIKKLREEISKMTDEEFANKYQGNIFSNYDKKSAIEILASGEKTYDNIPIEEVETIFESALKESKNKCLGSIFSNYDKKSATEILASIERIYDNIPKEELEKIAEAALKEFNNNPDEFVKLVKEGNIGAVLQTPELKKALKIAGISWVTFNVVITYAIESWLAELQLKAGRLGVMKSLEDLDDPRYYANIEPTA